MGAEKGRGENEAGEGAKVSWKSRTILGDGEYCTASSLCVKLGDIVPILQSKLTFKGKNSLPTLSVD